MYVMGRLRELGMSIGTLMALLGLVWESISTWMRWLNTRIGKKTTCQYLSPDGQSVIAASR